MLADLEYSIHRLDSVHDDLSNKISHYQKLLDYVSDQKTSYKNHIQSTELSEKDQYRYQGFFECLETLLYDLIEDQRG